MLTPVLPKRARSYRDVSLHSINTSVINQSTPGFYLNLIEVLRLKSSTSIRDFSFIVHNRFFCVTDDMYRVIHCNVESCNITNGLIDCVACSGSSKHTQSTPHFVLWKNAVGGID